MDEIHRILKERPWRHRPRRCLSRRWKLEKKRSLRLTALLIGATLSGDGEPTVRYTYAQNTAPVVEFHCEVGPVSLENPHPEAER